MKETNKSLSANEILELVFIYLAEVSALKDYDDIIVVLANMGRALTSADRCTVWVLNEEKKTIWTKVAHGMDPIEIPMDSGIVGDAIMNHEKEIIDDVYKDKRFNSSIDKKTGYRTKSMMVVPMFDYDDEIIGAFQVINRKFQDAFDKRDLERLMLASTYAAEAIVSARLSQEVEDTQREVVFTMGSIGESRSKETGNHVKRVAEYSKILALAYGMDEDEAELLKQASPMHDIGKIAIPDAILKKPGRFDENERVIMETHAELGYQMIKESKRPLLKAASIVAYEHHEKYNGTGYPRGLKGEEIHLYGRITALADVFDALGSNRVYKKAWPDERIFKLFKEERGEHFDPKLIDLFFENVDKFLAVREEFKDEYKGIDEKTDTRNKIKTLGAYGTKAKGYGTSSFLLNESNVLDAGNLLDGMDVASIEIENIWLTHSHLDHIADIANILDNYFNLRKKSLNIYGLPHTIQILKEDFLNDEIWPDFSQIPLANHSAMSVIYHEIELDKIYTLSENETIRAFKTDHTISSCGYIYKKGETSVMVTADTYSLDNVIDILNNDLSIKSFVVECSFSNELEKLAIASKHLTPKLLFKNLERLKRDDLSIYVNHIKPSFLTKVTNEIDELRGKFDPILLKDADFVVF